MPKKLPKNSHASLWLAIIIVGSFLVLVGISVFLQLRAKNTLGFCANSISCVKDLSGNKESAKIGVFMGKSVSVPETPNKPLYALNQTNTVLGDTTADYKHIYVDLTNQKLTAYEGNTKVYEFPVSTGKWGRTPTGDFRIWIWLKYTRMTGGDPALGTYYNLPNVPYTMFFYNSDIPKSRGYGLHGAYWHNNFGHPMSHGCVNLKPEDAGKLFYWTNPTGANTARPTNDKPGTLITIYGTAPTQ